MVGQMREFVNLTRCLIGACIMGIVMGQQQSKWTTVDWLQQLNYSHELHNVTTSDGYQLQLQRLPQVGARPVLLVHGLMGSSLGWLCLGPDKSLGMMCGWQICERYSFHEQGAYDLPAIIDYIVEVTSREGDHPQQQEQQREDVDGEQLVVKQQILLIGHSQAFNAFLVLCALQPRFNQRVLLMQALAPVARLRRQVRFDHTHVKDIMKFVKKRKKANKFEIFAVGELRKICRKKRELCEYYTKNLAGSSQNNKKLLDYLNFDYLLQGGSVRELQHLQQLWKSGDFIAFDFGTVENLHHYKSVEASAYNLSQISVPIILYFGETDAIATPQGVHDIYANMLHSVRGVRRIASPKFNHLDFLLSGDVKTLVNDKLIEFMEQFLEGKLPYVIE